MRSKTPLLLRAALTYLVATVAIFFYANAFADASGDSVTSWAQTWLVPYVTVVSATLSIFQSLVVRELTLDTGLWHTKWGHLLLTFFGALIGAATDFVAHGTFTKQAVVAAVTSALTAFGAAWKTEGKDASQKTETAKVRLPAAALLPFVILSLTLAGCLTPKPPVNPTGPTPTQQYDAAFGACMAQKGISVAVKDGTEIWQILDDPTTTQQEKIKKLEALGVTTGIGGLTDIAACALAAWQQVNPVLANVKPTPGQAAARVFTARHAPHAPSTGAEQR